MLIIGFTLMGLLLIVVQTTLFMLTPTWTAAPDFYFILVAYLAYRLDLFRGVVILLPLSSILDVFSGTIIGMYPALCFAGYFLLKFITVKLPIRESLYQVPLVAVCYLVVSRLVYLMLDFFQPDSLAVWSWPLELLHAAMIVVFAYPLFRFFEFFSRSLKGRILPIKSLRSRPRSGNRYR
jgi:rod shape-determining protein MreD